jgi:DnaK suppressor protein
MNTDGFREQLLEERRKASESLDYLRKENAPSMADEIPEDGMADTATGTLDREMDYSLEENTTNHLRDIDEALARIEAGSFGACRRCGGAIGEERLEAMPWAATCIDCKRDEERH